MTVSPLIEVRDLTKVFEGKRSFTDVVTKRPPDRLTAVDGVSLDVENGAAVGLVGESGCGKSTLARCLVGLYQPTSGEIVFEGRRLEGSRAMSDRRRMQIVFQDPYSSLNARMTVGQMIGEVLRVHEVVPRSKIGERTEELLSVVGLGVDVASVYPRQLSGGQRQRVSIARALAVTPDVLIADEPVSALDVSVQATVLNLLADIRNRLGLTLILIAHDLSVVRYLCEKVAVMYMGRVVESGPTEEIFADPRHPYTRGLIAAAPSLHRRANGEAPAVVGDPPSPYRIPAGCRFHPRCPIADDRCRVDDPVLVPGSDSPGHHAACHFAWTEVSIKETT